MTAKIIKLDEYIAELLDNNRPNIIQSIMADIGVDEETAKNISRAMTHDQELQMVNAHFDETLNDEQKLAVSHAIIDPILAIMDNQPFGGADIAEGYNFRRTIANEVARNNIMDWLEDNEVKYLIDNQGNFAVQCADRKTHYRVNRQFEHILNKWDKGPVGKNVDPTISRKPLADIAHIGKPLTNGLNEAPQDASMPLPDASGTPPMFPAKDGADVTDGLPAVYENTEEGAMRVLGDLINPSSMPHTEMLDEEVGEWLVCDDTAERSYFVNTYKGVFEEVEYICEAQSWSRGGGHAPGILGPRSDDPRGDRHDLPTRFDTGGAEVPADTMADMDTERYAAFEKIPLELMKNATTDKEKIKLMRYYGILTDAIPPKYEMNYIPKFDEALEGRLALEMIAEAKTKTAKQRIKAAKDKLDKKRPGEGMAGAMAAANRQKTGVHDDGKTSPKKNIERKKKHKGRTDEGVLGAATGMTGMPTIGINRLRQLAGLPVDSMMITTEVPVQKEEKNEPIIQHGNELHEINDALDHLDEVFNIYKTLNTEDKKELRFNLISSIMDNGDRLSESVIGLLLNKDDKTSMLLEFDGDGEVLSEDDKEYLKEVIAGIKDAIVEDINRMDDSVTIGLARIAYLLEMLQHQMEESK